MSMNMWRGGEYARWELCRCCPFGGDTLRVQEGIWIEGVIDSVVGVIVMVGACGWGDCCCKCCVFVGVNDD